MTRYPIVVVYAVRGEPQWLVDQMRANVAWVDEFVEINNRGARGRWQDEGRLRQRQRQAVAERTAGAPCWLLQLDPDERLEDRAASVVPKLVAEVESGPLAAQRCTILSFALREMWTPTQYRTDHAWARKLPRARMFWFDPGDRDARYLYKPIHCGILPTLGSRRIMLDTDIWMLHLKNIEPLNRVRRAAAYLAADPNFVHQRREGRDWTWLYDEDGLTLADIPPERAFSPPYDRPYHFTAPGEE